MKNWHYLQRSVPSHFFCQIFQKFIFPKMSIYYVFRSAESESGIHFSLRGFRTRICQHLPRKCQHLKMLLYRVKRDFFAFLGSRNPNIIQDFHILHCYQDFVLESDDDEQWCPWTTKNDILLNWSELILNWYWTEPEIQFSSDQIILVWMRF